MITSKDNNKIKYLKKLKQKKYRDLENKFLVFGDDLINEAKMHGKVLEVFTSNTLKEGTLVSDAIIKDLDENKSVSDVFALCEKTNKSYISNKILVLEDVQDPKNVGALLRSASAFGFRKVILSDKSADIYNEKTIRASKGAIFHLDILRTNIYSEIANLKKLGYSIYSTILNGDTNISLKEKSVLVLGNEGKGISDKIKDLSDYGITIKTTVVESLNVVVAGSIIMYEGMK